MLKWLENWYSEQCDGDWEHCYGVKIDTLDNPGWRLHIDIAETSLAEKEFAEYNHDNGDDDWSVCCVKNDAYDACGDPSKLEDLIRVFKEWTEE